MTCCLINQRRINEACRLLLLRIATSDKCTYGKPICEECSTQKFRVVHPPSGERTDEEKALFLKLLTTMGKRAHEARNT